MSIFDETLATLKKKINGVEVNARNIITILRFAMEAVEATQLKGSAQKELCNRLVKQIIIDAPISDSKEKLLLDMVEQDILASTMDLVIDATKGNIDINKAIKVASGCCSAFMKCKN